MSTPSLSLPADRARPLALTFPRPELSVLLAADVMGARGRAVIVAGAVAALPFAPASWSL